MSVSGGLWALKGPSPPGRTRTPETPGYKGLGPAGPKPLVSQRAAAGLLGASSAKLAQAGTAEVLLRQLLYHMILTLVNVSSM